MKFYYNGKLIRTSKSRHYKYAIGIEGTGFPRCSETLENAKKQLEQEVKERIETAKNNLLFAEKPENLAWLKERFGEDYNPVEEYKKALKRAQMVTIVELEER